MQRSWGRSVFVEFEEQQGGESGRTGESSRRGHPRGHIPAVSTLSIAPGKGGALAEFWRRWGFPAPGGPWALTSWGAELPGAPTVQDPESSQSEALAPAHPPSVSALENVWLFNNHLQTPKPSTAILPGPLTASSSFCKRGSGRPCARWRSRWPRGEEERGFLGH